MHIVSFIFSLAAAVLSFLQGGCGSCAGVVGSELSKEMGEHGNIEELSMFAVAGMLVVIASFIGITGGILAMQKKKSAFVTLIVSAVICVLAYAGGFTDAIIYGIMYLIAAICSRCQKN